jgi:hypothetical protein
MGVAEFINNNLLGEEIFIFLGENAETITYDQSWAANKEFFCGIVEDISDNILSLNISGSGIIYINCDQIVSFWRPGFNYHKAIRTSLTNRMIGARRKD